MAYSHDPPTPVEVPDAETGPPPRPRTGIGPFSRRQLLTIVFSAGLVAIVLFAVTRPLTGQTPATQLPGASFYLIGSETEGIQIGQRAPDFTGTNGGQTVRLTDLDGNEIALSDFAGRPIWVNFWATWCPPCQRETPDIRAAYEAHRDEGLVVLAIDVQEPAEIVREYADRYGLSYTIGLDTYGAVMKTYGVFGLPTHYFVDRSGVIRDRYFGPLTRAQIDERIQLISGN